MDYSSPSFARATQPLRFTWLEYLLSPARMMTCEAIHVDTLRLSTRTLVDLISLCKSQLAPARPVPLPAPAPCPAPPPAAPAGGGACG